MAGRPKARARLAALQKMQAGEPLTPEEQELLNTPGRPIRDASGQTRTFAGNTSKVDRDGSKTGISDDDMHAVASRVAQHPAVLDLLSSKLVEEPEGAAFSHQAVQLLAQSGTPDTEIARLLNITVKTLREHATDALELGQTQHRVSLRLGQYRAAMVGDRSLLIWLGKQSLGQVDRAVNEISGRDGKPIEVTDGANDVRGKLMRLIAATTGEEQATALPPAGDPPPALPAGDAG
jgi:hypothetical protein